MTFWEIFFWTGTFLIFYTYIGYAIILWIINNFTRKKILNPGIFIPDVTVVVPVFNEEDVIEKKICNCLDLDYPQKNITLLFVDDGSADKTSEIIGSYPDIQLIPIEKRSGKTAALNYAMQFVKTAVVVFTDANSFVDPMSLKKIVRHYTNNKVGGVAGEKKISKQLNDSIVSDAEQLYWKYESFLKKTDSEFYSVVGADGGLFSIRTELFKPVDESVILDDFFISVNICEQGYRFVYDAEAFATEAASTSIKEEQKRKIRISAGCFQALSFLKRLLNPFTNFRLFFLYVSHRVLRWVLCPVLIPVLFIINILLAKSSICYQYFFILQCAFYVLALIGYITVRTRSKIKLLSVPYYFVFMNLSLYLGFLRFLKGKQTVLWEKPRRNLL